MAGGGTRTVAPALTRRRVAAGEQSRSAVTHTPISDPAGTHSDGTLIFGTQLFNIGPLTGLIADDIDIDDATNVLTRKNNVGVPAAEVQMDDVMTGTATIQLPSATVALPAKGTQFNLVDVTGTSLPFKVHKWGRKYGSDKETKLKLDFRQKLNPAAQS